MFFLCVIESFLGLGFCVHTEICSGLCVLDIRVSFFWVLVHDLFNIPCNAVRFLVRFS